ncbi:MAG: DMT family transporter [Erysipelotrichaceae bacterium]|nr:DMT family transporter [Erysipelotrichaceae bacterium]
MSKKVRNIVLLFTIALIWGLSFSAQRSGASTLAPFTFYNFRNYFAVWTMSILIIFNRKNIEISKKKESIKAGIILGVIDFLALAVQQIGIGYTTASKSSFITATYVIMVPLFAAIFGKKIKKSLWLCVFLEIVGLYLLCVNDNFVINIGDIITFAGAFFFAIHILLIEKEGDKMDTLIFCFVQYIICAILSTICMLAFEMPIDVEGIKASWFALAYTGILSSAVCVTIQVFVQKEVDSTIASLIMCLESVFGAFGGWLILHEVLSTKQILGCLLAFVAIVISQLPDRKKH